jgi:hypothetical protein
VNINWKKSTMLFWLSKMFVGLAFSLKIPRQAKRSTKDITSPFLFDMLLATGGGSGT